ncbi:RNA polymerase sigma factor [Fodinicola acaciae]|uniref:RNA polymerase sigma factor n=1 Tax=Fodinicola acaciae TaxID=2681555 RepID=UPI0013D04E7D|nr:sigma-70 family RNA polymerase sigma factor [Fodinicola acaciae]
MSPRNPTEDLLRTLAPQVLGALVRRYGHFDLAEEAVQEALLAAATRWPSDGVPDSPRSWLITVASRQLTDLLRSEQARRRREDRVARWTPPEQWLSPPADRTARESDDTLVLLFLCCHPSLSPASQIALTLRAVAGLDTRQIARAFLVPEATMTRRISRAKQSIRASGIPFRPPTPDERGERLSSVLHVLYLIFTEGYRELSDPADRTDLVAEAIRLTRLVHRLLPEDAEVAGLLALMLLTDARRPARVGPDGTLIPMADQDRGLWRPDQIAEGTALLEATLPRGDVGPYQIQAAIAALHDQAPAAEKTDWAQIAALYEVLMRLSDNPVVRLNHAVAMAMSRGAEAGIELLDRLELDQRLTDDHRLYAARAHLAEMTGDHARARELYEVAARRTTSLAHQRHLRSRAARLPG